MVTPMEGFYDRCIITKNIMHKHQVSYTVRTSGCGRMLTYPPICFSRTGLKGGPTRKINKFWEIEIACNFLPAGRRMEPARD